MNLKGKDLVALAGSILLFVGLFLQFFRLTYAPYVYLVGSFVFGYVQVMNGYSGKSFVLRRLYRQQQIGSILLFMAGILMIVWHNNEWILCLAIAAFLELYTAFRIPQEEKKETEKK